MFTSLIVVVLGRAGWGYFYGHLWQGRTVDSTAFLEESLVWIILWGLVLRWVLFAWVRMGLHRDVAALTGRLPSARLVDPLIGDFAGVAEEIGRHIEVGDRLAGEARGLAARLDEPVAGLGRLRHRSDP